MKIHGHLFQVDVTVSHHFRASHSLPMRPKLHPHDWEVEFTISGRIDPRTGMVCDMLELSEFFRPYVQELDQRVLHEVASFAEVGELVGVTAKYPTCDTLAHYFMWKTLPLFREQYPHLEIRRIMVKIAEPDQHEPWGWASIRPEMAP